MVSTSFVHMDLVAFTEKILNGKRYFCAVKEK